MGIERYRAIVRLEEIRTLSDAGDYEAAKEIADSIRKEKLKDSADLFLLAEVYRKCGELATAKEILLRVYEKKVTWRVLEELMEVCLAEKNPEEAQTYLKQYGKLSGGDPRGYIFEYRIGRQMHRPDEELLPVLQTLKAEEYTEKYAYELAKLYHKLGREEECMAECSDLILWFGEGTYVERAKVLQAYYRGELSADDIRQEADRRVREAEERRAREEEERKAFEEEQRRIAEEQQLAEEESQRIEEEEHLALTEVYRAVAEERFEAEEAGEQQEAVAEDDFLEEVAATEEPMWETDASEIVAEEDLPEEELPAEEVSVGAVSERAEEDYEQMSLFAPQENPVQEEPAALTPLGKELSARLAEKGLVFEELLHEFAYIERVRKQLVRMLEVVVTVRKKCHCLIITGEDNSGKTSLGTYLAKLLYELSYVKTPRVAKISAERLNKIDLNEKKEQLQDVCLIVENAGMMTETTAENLLWFIHHTNVLGTVILEDNATAISNLLRNQAECNREFNNRVHLPKYDSGELLLFALGYIKEQDYEIDSEAMKILTDRIDYVTRVEQKEGRLAATMETVKEALKNADDRNQGTILAMASAANFHAAEALELTAEDFGVIR
ncbi:MAG: hypothetical protein IKT67_07995 [Lachnospiraceae bacterium]|nr:hypothetical protein [Lachnospiraceae bacterium]